MKDVLDPSLVANTDNKCRDPKAGESAKGGGRGCPVTYDVSAPVVSVDTASGLQVRL